MLEEGIPDANVPACSACHGPEAKGTAKTSLSRSALSLHRKGLRSSVLDLSWLIGGALSEIAYRVKLFHGSWSEAWRRLGNLPRSAYGSALAHAGLGIVVIGIVATTAWRSESILALKPKESAEIAGLRLTFEGVAPREGPNYRERVGLFKVARGGQPVTTLEPSKREFTVERSGTTEAGIHASWRGDLHGPRRSIEGRRL